MYKTPSRERICEIQLLEGNSNSTQKYTQNQKRRFSEFSASVASTSTLRRRASEMTKPLSEIEAPSTPAAGIICSNTDLISILSSLTSSATEINTCGTSNSKDEQKSSWSSKTAEQKRSRLKSSRSNSFDVSILSGDKSKALNSSGKTATPASLIAPSTWFVKRHQPISKKNRYLDENSRSFKVDKSCLVKVVKDTLGKTSPTKDLDTRHKVVWDDKSGTKVDAQVNHL